MTSYTPSLRRKRSGFTLIEVSLAVLVLGLGLMAAFGLFPAGVRQNEESTADTRAGLFADYVLNGMQANAAAVTDWSAWTAEAGNNYSRILGTAVADLAGVNLTANPVGIEWPSSSGRRLRYSLAIVPSSLNLPNSLYTATLVVKDLDDGSDFGVPDGVFYTAFIFKGM